MHFDIYEMNGNSSFISGETGAWRNYEDVGVTVTSRVVFSLCHKHTCAYTHINTQSYKYIHMRAHIHHTHSYILTHIHIYTHTHNQEDLKKIPFRIILAVRKII